MKNTTFYITYAIIFFALLGVGCSSYGEKKALSLQSVTGNTMGTTYQVKFIDSLDKNLKPALDSILEDINLELSTYIDSSLISRFNQYKSDTFRLTMPSQYGMPRHFPAVFQEARQIYMVSEGAFDPTVMPVVNYWGFGYKKTSDPRWADSLLIDSLRQLIGYDKIESASFSPGNSNYLVKKEKHSELDYSAIAKGYAVDYLGEYLESIQIHDYLVEIGGEVRARGSRKEGQPWVIGINIPKPDARVTDFLAKLPLKNQSCATSGNYRNFVEVDGVRYGHTINPKTARPEMNRLLSATVVTKNCMVADAWATAFMVMGLEKAQNTARENQDLEALFVYSSDDGAMEIWSTTNFPNMNKKE